MISSFEPAVVDQRISDGPGDLFGELLALMERPAWHAHAACRGADPDVFFSEGRTPLAHEPAKAYCQTCPVTAECLAQADSYGETVGLWGGLSTAERVDGWAGLSPKQRRAAKGRKANLRAVAS